LPTTLKDSHNPKIVFPSFHSPYNPLQAAIGRFVSPDDFSVGNVPGQSHHETSAASFQQFKDGHSP
jgi:hypothetical protein